LRLKPGKESTMVPVKTVNPRGAAVGVVCALCAGVVLATVLSAGGSVTDDAALLKTLAAKVESLEQRVKILEQNQTTHTQAAVQLRLNGRPLGKSRSFRIQQTPDDCRPIPGAGPRQEVNGIPYYIVPMESE
jgi:hypothetical protein